LPNIPNPSPNQSPSPSLPDTSTLPAKPAPTSLNKRERGAVLWSIIKKLSVFAKPYHSLIMATLLLTVVGSFAAQVNAFVLRYTVDHLTEILKLSEPWQEGAKLLTTISIVLLLKELLYAAISFGQRYFGEKIRINLSRDLSQKVVARILSYRMGFYTHPDNDSGKLQTRIDLGVSSLTRLVQNFFIDMLPKLFY